MTGPERIPQTLPNPFVGPRPIEKGQPIFGRDQEIADLYDLLCAERIVLLHSPSGAGKSSLIQAGLIPRLTAQFDVWKPVRVNLEPPPGSAVNRYVRSCNLGFESGLPERLKRDEETISAMTLAEYVAGRPRRPGAAQNIVLIFDQFEEVLTVDPLAVNTKREFFIQLGKLLQDNPRIWALFVIREDYIAPFDAYAEQLPTHLKIRFRLDLLGRAAAEEAIRKSVEAGGRSFAPHALSRLVADLATMQVQQPDGEFKREPGPYIEPLHLQVSCRILWGRMPPERTVIEDSDVDAFGNVTSALSEYYETEVARATDGHERIERSIREWCGTMLITRGNIRRQVLREAGQSGGLDNRLVERMIDTHLVRAEQRAGATWYELSHDRMVEPVLRNNEAWFATHLAKVQQRAVQWENEGRPDSLLFVGAELAAALRWAASYGKEQTKTLTEVELHYLAACRKKQSRLLQARAAVALLAVLLLVASAMYILARRERDRAEFNLQLANRAVDESLSAVGRQQGQVFAGSPETDAFRKTLLDKAADFYSIFTKEDSDNQKIRTDAAWAHSRIADVNRLLERRELAAKEYREAIVRFQALMSRYPNQREYPRALAYCHNFLGETLRAGLERSETPDPKIRAEASDEYDAALNLQQSLHNADPANTEDTQSLARSYYNRGILNFDGSDRKDAENDFRAAIALLEPIAGHPASNQPASIRPGSNEPSHSSTPPAEELARVYNNLAVLEEDEDRSEEARTLFEKAIKTAGELVSSNPQEREYQAELALYCEGEARMLVDTNQLDAAAHRNHQALDIIEELANPAPALSLEQAKILQLRSEILLDQGSPDALDQSDQALGLLQRLAPGATHQSHPLFHVVYKDLAVNYVELATSELRDGDLRGAGLSLKSLARVIPELLPEDKEAAEQSYQELEHKLSSKLSGRK